MKIIFFLVLAGLSLSHGFQCIEKRQAATSLKCLQNALEIAPKFLEKLVYFLCNYEEGIENNKKEFEDALRELIAILECAGCTVDKLIGTKVTVEELLGDIGGAGKDAIYAILKIADELKLTGPVADLACSLLKGLGTPGGLVDLGGILGGVLG
ncbi:ranaspumin-like [Bufo gargarizans]|uniref:ranaspumin-like n=1 Tax=Bufo gargarizans TaxID=30331 RepID=UPI001CF10D1D|nr:ranaspumin-like [Bufo gargarizans]XP_044158256.1 ranaspumin-like [Bufo gargarizans]XP_044158257.1 ranaspumin-like [Bufo gargarizans]